MACLCCGPLLFWLMLKVSANFFLLVFVLGTPITYPRGLIKGWLIYTRHFRAGPAGQAGTSAAGCPQGEYIYLELVKYLNFNKMSFHPEWGRALSRRCAFAILILEVSAKLFFVGFLSGAHYIFWRLALPPWRPIGIITGAYNGTKTKMNFCTQYAEIRDTHTV